MPGSGTAKCDRCEFTDEVFELWDGVGGLYRISSSLSIPLMVRWAWCHQCDGIRYVERIPDIKEIKQELRRSFWNVSKWGEGIWRCTGATSRRHHRRVLKSILAWRRNRKSPPRCLCCGSLDFEVFSGDLEFQGIGTVPHPGCGGTIHCEISGLWTGVSFGQSAYSPEGFHDGVFCWHEDQWMHFASEETYRNLTGKQHHNSDSTNSDE